MNDRIDFRNNFIWNRPAESSCQVDCRRCSQRPGYDEGPLDAPGSGRYFRGEGECGVERHGFFSLSVDAIRPGGSRSVLVCQPPVTCRIFLAHRRSGLIVLAAQTSAYPAFKLHRSVLAERWVKRSSGRDEPRHVPVQPPWMRQRPWKTGSRFSTKARAASRWSSVCPQ